MPAASFDATAAAAASILVHTMEALDPAVFETLQAEDALLVQSCQRSGSSQRIEETDSDGRLVLSIHYDQRLVYSIQADVLEWDGLADYHPGRALSARALDFINGTQAMQFEDSGTLVYVSPQQTAGAGQLPSIAFQVERLFADLDTAAYPSGTASSFTYLATQAVAELPASATTALLEAVFYGNGISGDLTATLFNGNPASGGTAVSSAIVCEPWTAAAPIVSGGDTAVITSSEITFPSTGSSRTVTHVRFKRGASLVALDVALASTLTLAANHALRADAGDFSAQLEWPYGLSGGTTPAELALRYLFADPTVDLVGDATEVTISCYPATVIGSEPLDVFTVSRDNSTWDIVGDTCGNASTITGTNIAPAGGWAVQILVASIEGVGTWFIRRERLISVGAGQPVTIATGILSADLNGL
jgi:hypothetical protein